jgi:hypothetical protein
MHRRDEWHLGIDEVSGLGRRRNPRSGRVEVLAVGDREPVIVTLGADDDGALPRERGHRGDAVRHRVSGLPDRLDGSGGHVDWEGVAGDAHGRIAVLRESGSRVLVISPTFRYERTVTLAWDRAEKGGLESVLLLGNGHLLSATEYPPLRLMEFAAPGEPSQGLQREAALAPDRPMLLPSAPELHCVASWGIADDAVGSINDLALSDDHLVVVSSASRVLARFRLPRPGEEVLERETTVPLPDDVAGGRDAKAEGLLVDPDLGVLVGVDRPRGARGPNLFRLTPKW